MPDSWLGDGEPLAVTNFPTVDGGRLDMTISVHDRSVSLSLRGRMADRPILFQLPVFVRNIKGASSGTIDQATGTVTLDPGRRNVTVELRRPPGRG